LLRRQTNTTWAYEVRIGRLEALESPTSRALEVDVLAIGGAEREVGRTSGVICAQLAGLGGIVEIDPRGLILGFVPIPHGDTATTLAPASASAVTMPRPMPKAAPATMAVLSEMSMCEASVYFG
jgi:hypothetical protein